MRSISKDNVCVYSVREIEESIRRCDEMMDILTAPKEIAPVDLYYENQAMRTQKLEALLNKRSMQDQYNVFYSFAFTKLNYYKTIDICVHNETDTDAHANNKKVFIIYGHNEAKRRELKELLQKLGLQPVVLPEQPDLGQTIIEKFEKCASDCSYAFAILTPDDNVVKEKYSYFQARPNVIFELGWFYSRLGRKRVCVLDQIRDNVNIFSDLQGIMRITFTKDINEKYIDITKELKSVGLIE